MRRLATLCIALLPCLGAMTCLGAPGDEYSRAGKWEFYGIGQYGEITLAPVSSLQAGAGFGYNIIDQLNINADVEGGSLGAGALGISVNTTLMSGHVGLDYNILRTRLTPFITVGAGLYYLPVASTTLYSGDVGIGCRWDFNDRWFAKLAYEPTLAMHTGLDSGILDHVFSLSIGVKF